MPRKSLIVPTTLISKNLFRSMSLVMLLGNVVWGVVNGFSSRAHRCELLATKNVCLEQTRGHNLTSMPNLLGHENQREAEEQMSSFQPLMMYGCSKRLELLLCSTHFPYCTEKVPELFIGPCQGLCESVRESCEPILNNFGFGWPDSLNCSRFPRLNDVNQMCVEGPRDDVTLARAEQTATHLSPGHSSASLVLKERHDFKMKLCSHLKSPESYLVTQTYDHLVSCSRKCSSHVAFSYEQKKKAGMFLVLLVVVCFVIFLTAMLSNILSRGRLANHQRFPFHVILCTTLYCLALLIRLLIGREMASCQRLTSCQLPFASQSSDMKLVSLSPGHSFVSATMCLTLFCLSYFGIIASSAWFTMTTLMWCSNSRKQTSSCPSGRRFKSWNERSKTPRKAKLCLSFLKIASWGFPAVLCSCVVLSGAVEGEELLGFCVVSPGLTAIYLALYLIPVCNFCILMILFTFAGFVARWRDDKPHAEKSRSRSDHKYTDETSTSAKFFIASDSFRRSKNLKMSESRLVREPPLDPICDHAAPCLNRLSQIVGQTVDAMAKTSTRGQARKKFFLKLQDGVQCSSNGNLELMIKQQRQQRQQQKQQQQGKLPLRNTQQQSLSERVDRIYGKHPINFNNKNNSNSGSNKNNNSNKNRNVVYEQTQRRRPRRRSLTYDGGIACLIGTFSFAVLAVSSLVELTNHEALYQPDLETTYPSVSDMAFWITVVRMTSSMMSGLVCSISIIVERKEDVKNFWMKAKQRCRLEWKTIRDSRKQTTSGSSQDGDEKSRDVDIRSCPFVISDAKNHNNAKSSLAKENQCGRTVLKSSSRYHHYHGRHGRRHLHLHNNHHQEQPDYVDDTTQSKHFINRNCVPATVTTSYKTLTNPYNFNNDVQRQEQLLNQHSFSNKCCRSIPQQLNKMGILYNSMLSPHAIFPSDNDDDVDHNGGGDDDDDDDDEELIGIMKSVMKGKCVTSKTFYDVIDDDDDSDNDVDDDSDNDVDDDDNVDDDLRVIKCDEDNDDGGDENRTSPANVTNKYLHCKRDHQNQLHHVIVCNPSFDGQPSNY